MPSTTIRKPRVLVSPHYPSRQAPTFAEAQVSPFLLHHSSVRTTALSNGTRHHGTWLHSKVTIQSLPSQEEALRTASYVARLRHPNVESFLGVVTKHSPSLVTACISGPTLANLPSISLRCAATLAVHVARAVVYVHAVVGPHGNVRAKEVIFDKERERAVLLLSPNIGYGYKSDDVKGLANIAIMLLGGSHRLPSSLATILSKALGERRFRPSAEDVCKALRKYEETLQSVR